MALDPLVFRISLLALMILFGIIKMTLTQRNLTENEKEGNNYPLNINLILAVAAIGIILVPFIWVFSDVLSFAEVELSDSIRLIGILLYVSMILLMYWQMKTLDVNISTVRDDRYLVTEGPYRYIRHPLYAIFIGITVAMTLIASNWVFGVFVPIVLFAMLLRVRYEENILKNEYGQTYLDYMERTKKLIPKIY